jgi:AmiR/NasT family two-component response regulator
MNDYGFDEHSAWRFIQTQAMQRRAKIGDVARLVIDGEISPA